MLKRLSKPTATVMIFLLQFQPLLVFSAEPVALPAISSSVPLAVHRYALNHDAVRRRQRLDISPTTDVEAGLAQWTSFFNERMRTTMPAWLRDETRPLNWFEVTNCGNPYHDAVMRIQPLLEARERAAFDTFGVTAKEQEALAEELFQQSSFSTSNLAKLGSLPAGWTGKLLESIAGKGFDLVGKAIEDEIVDRMRSAIFGSEIDEVREDIAELRAMVENNLTERQGFGKDVAVLRGAAMANLLLNWNAQFQIRRILAQQVDAAHSIADLNVAVAVLGEEQRQTRTAVENLEKVILRSNETLGRIEETTRKNHVLLHRSTRGVNVLLREQFLSSNSRNQLRMLRETPDLLKVAPEKLAALKTRLKLEVAMEDIDTYMRSANAALQVLAKLGLDPEITKIASFAIKAGSALNNAASKIANRDFVGAVIGLIGALFGGGPNAAEQRHAEVMAKLRNIERTARQTYVQTLHIRQDLADLSDKIARNHREIVDRLGVMDEKLTTVLENMGELHQLVSGYRMALQFLANEEEYRPKTLDEIVNLLREDADARTEAVLVANSLRKFAETQGGTSRFLALLRFASNPAHPKYQRTLHRWRAIRDLVGENRWHDWLWALSSPALSVSSLDARASQTVPSAKFSRLQVEELLSPVRV